MMLIFFEIFLLLVFLLAIISLLLNVRIKLAFSRFERSVFLGLGRSGAELDFLNRKAILKLFGGNLRSFSMAKRAKGKGIKEKISEALDSREDIKAEKIEKQKKPKHLAGWLKILPDTIKPLWRYMLGIFKSAKIEEVNGEISGGFESPDLTGQAFGYFQAAQSALPSILGKVKYQPDWEGASIDGSFKLSIAMPVYRLVAESILLVFRLPVMKILKLAIAK